MGLTCPTVTLTPGPGTIGVSWAAVSGAVDYLVEVFNNSAGTGSPVAQSVETGTSASFDGSDGIASSTQYWVRVTPNDDVHADPNCALQSVTTQAADTTPPSLLSASVEDATPTNIEVYYNETLNTASLTTSKFSIEINLIPVNVLSANAAGNKVTIVIDTAVNPGDLVKAYYTAGSSGSRIADTSANFANSFSNQPVTNNVV